MHSRHYQTDKEHGLAIERITEVRQVPLRLLPHFWEGAFVAIVHSTKITHHPDGPREEHAYRAATQSLDAALAATLVRGHWSIENNLHGARDILLHEDACQATGWRARGLGYARTWALNLMRVNHQKATKPFMERMRDFGHLAEWVLGS